MAGTHGIGEGGVKLPMVIPPAGTPQPRKPRNQQQLPPNTVLPMPPTTPRPRPGQIIDTYAKQTLHESKVAGKRVRKDPS